ncbi:4-carboxy-4-hydroxy-2-oxoadipate aldolase/oxaloacetate decarboxylase [Futiania mangrovi]|uniref:Putative 4-hydroxy-4-methyl-2-oxoglutarate aldolase n=1 Tax=Futiania mangrovi TaxID=2959716 RepID=A0A9J6PAD5_9PROT|nr:4-carboxy-4-hydroxy-2-oxoadipate aldolase/oxaloacetate decarboxylase [Futiania mangrovii]MCP1337028.1 4-carboxy-4-hydroxy-2-oxoadipate aldolase/oxaloacetate decarboxylase [Futiania mangrovii]
MHSSVVYRRVTRVDAAVCEAAKTVSVSDVHEAMPLSEARRGLMSPRMRPLNRSLRIAGPAVTAHCAPGDNLMMHRALYLAEPGDVLVVVCQSETSGAQWGDMAARYALRKGLAGVVVQGAIRDTDELERMTFPVWSTAVSPIRPGKAGAGAVNVPVACDGVIVRPGDMIMADGDGVICVPREGAAAAVEAARERMTREDTVAAAIADGAHLWDLAKLQSAFDALDVEEIDGPCPG